MPKKLPPITILIPTLNEANFIENCIHSLLNGNYPKELIEILIIDGNSSDKTRLIIESISKQNKRVFFLENSKKIVPAAMNIGINAASNEIIVWAGAHALYDTNYLLYSVTTLLKDKCSSVGGIITPTAKTFTGKAIALATSSKYGIGNAKYRYAKEKQTVDTVFAGCWRKKDALKIGGFNEQMIRNQDYEFNYRLRTKIGKIILDPRIKCQYFCRETIPDLAKQYFSYGYWRFNTLKHHPNSFTIRQAAPLILFFGLFSSLTVALVNLKLASIFPLFYIASTILASMLIATSNKKLKYILILTIIFITLHVGRIRMSSMI